MKEERGRSGSCTDGEKPMRLYERVSRLFGIPSDAVGLSDGFMAEMRGRCGVTVRGCRRILTYSDSAVTLLTRDGEVTVSGVGLTCAAYYSGAIGIDGRIDGVFFEGARKPTEGER